MTHRKFVDLPINSMVDLSSSLVNVYQRLIIPIVNPIGIWFHIPSVGKG